MHWLEAMKNSLMHENQRLHRLFSEDDLDDSVYNMYPSKSVDYGIHLATRHIKGNIYKEIQTRFVIGNNINAADMSALYFMHYIGGGGLSLDSGIYYKDNKFYVFNFGTIDRKWDDSLLPNVSPGDTVYVNTRITNSQIITSVKKNGVLVGTQVNNLSKRVARLGFNMAREFNIASKNPLTGSDNYFSWSNAQSTLTTVRDNLVQMNSFNSNLKDVYYDIKERKADSVIGLKRRSYSSGGYVYDEVWCRCNFGSRK